MNDLTITPGTGAPDSGAAPDTTNTPAVVEQEKGSTETTTNTPPPEKTEEQKRIEKLERENRKYNRNNARLHAELEAARRPQQPQKGEPQRHATTENGEGETPPETFTKEQVAEFYRQQREHDRESERVATSVERTISEGRKAHKDFDAKTQELAEAVDLFDAKGRPTAITKSLLECEKSHDLIVHLAGNPDLAAEIADLSPTQQIRRLARLEAELEAKAKPQTSAAPKPLTTVKTASSTSDEPDPAKDPKGWIAWRNKSASGRR